MDTQIAKNLENEELWHQVLTSGHRHGTAILPGAPKCLICSAPLGGLGAPIARAFNRRPSRKNPNMCDYCEVAMPMGGAEIQIGVLFADIRGSTALAERVGPQSFAQLLNRFYQASVEALIPHGTLIDKMVGDEVVALFLPLIGPDYLQRAAIAAVDLQHAVGAGSPGGAWLPLGIGVHVGPAVVGKFGKGNISDFTALGDTMNTCARLQAEAKAGEIVISEEALEGTSIDCSGAERATLALRGREQSLTVRVIRVG